jgi:hypothetical protein
MVVEKRPNFRGATSALSLAPLLKTSKKGTVLYRLLCLTRPPFPPTTFLSIRTIRMFRPVREGLNKADQLVLAA